MPYRISYLKPRLLIQPQNSRMKSSNQTEIAYQLSNLGSICTRLMSNLAIFVIVRSILFDYQRFVVNSHENGQRIRKCRIVQNHHVPHAFK